MAEIKNIFFDLDGTIIDSERIAAECIQRWFRQHTIPITAEDGAYISGRKWEAGIEYLLQKYQRPESLEEITNAIVAEYRKILETELPVVPGSVQAIQALSQVVPLGLISGSKKQDILWALTKLGVRECFQVILGSEDYLKSKPAPDGYIKAAQSFGVNPNEVVAFEDSVPGIASARSAGLWVIAVTSTNHFKQDLGEAHHSISDFTTVSWEWLRKLSAGF